MSDAPPASPKRILVVEDDFLTVEALSDALRAEGFEVIGPVGNVERALQLVDATPAIDGAVVDVNLRGKMSFTVIDALQARHVPVALMTGYDRSALPPRYAAVPRCEKPFNISQVTRALFQS
ncbi:response regulator [Rhizosaccharibacter radicis]|uniref:Response regulator n=1 Tax=Rhizosaccharibacter radicis TaxID=2782605 RepID=A0ABT1VSP9_9PROT|nr:response regulator [Acetobacteraceae bacterium KSS12]